MNGDNQQIIYAIPLQTSRKCKTIPYLNTSIEDKEFIRPLQRSPFDGRFDYAEVPIRPNAVQMDGDHDGDSIIDEVVADNPGNVREQIYNAFLNWYQMTCPEK
ncbi:hypothetical protein FSP39_007809 [Pinctada imbricata]|uniref:Uncharacterized protein n=1 Tax=Pinctada imbricata TaxID=66713 RepID=A0AA88YN81_PINIB|nr:hypothetical protein FSP39_007809 [Pinctada imbricata]